MIADVVKDSELGLLTSYIHVTKFHRPLQSRLVMVLVIGEEAANDLEGR